MFSYIVQTMKMSSVAYNMVMDYVSMNVIAVVTLTSYESRSVSNFYYDISSSWDYVIDVFCCYYGSEVIVT